MALTTLPISLELTCTYESDFIRNQVRVVGRCGRVTVIGEPFDALSVSDREEVTRQMRVVIDALIPEQEGS